MPPATRSCPASSTRTPTRSRPSIRRWSGHDGVTTILDTEAGVASAPFFYDKYEGNSFLNYGVGISHEMVRRVILDGLTIEQCSDPTDMLISRGARRERRERQLGARHTDAGATSSDPDPVRARDAGRRHRGELDGRVHGLRRSDLRDIRSAKGGEEVRPVLRRAHPLRAHREPAAQLHARRAKRRSPTRSHWTERSSPRTSRTRTGRRATS